MTTNTPATPTDLNYRASMIAADALAIDESNERQAHIEIACGADVALRVLVLKLIETEHSTVRHGSGEHINTDPWLNQDIGPYRITRLIAQGGMGAVYEAKRVDQAFDKTVAIKLIQTGLNREEVTRRFMAERQILANLNHPHIARLLDGGSTSNNTPYVVMDYIEGLPIDRHCHEKQLHTKERLALFKNVCQAVHYAHQNLIVHRDLKPSNIMVDQQGQVKLLDFGIAKLMDNPELTVINAMTPAYASPEQIKGQAITTASDVYALGVLLYKLLTGQSPYKVDPTKSHDLAKAIVDTDPERPSFATLDQERINSTIDAKRLSKELTGDLDNIILMALRKDPQRRYASAQQFAEDIDRHLKLLPVLARPDTLGYRAQKFIERNKYGVLASLLAALGLAMSTGVAVYQEKQAKAAQLISEAQRVRAEGHLGNVRKLANSLIWEIHDRIRYLNGAQEAREEILTLAKNYFETLRPEVESDPALKREVAHAIGRLARMYYMPGDSHSGRVEEGLALHQISKKMYEEVAATGAMPLRSALDLAMTARVFAKIDIEQGNFQQAIKTLLPINSSLERQETRSDDDRYKVSKMLSLIHRELFGLYSGEYGRGTWENKELALRSIDESIRLANIAQPLTLPKYQLQNNIDLLDLQTTRADFLSDFGRVEEIRTTYHQVLDTLEGLNKAQPDHFLVRDTLARHYFEFANLEELFGSEKKAFKLLNLGLAFLPLDQITGLDRNDQVDSYLFATLARVKLYRRYQKNKGDLIHVANKTQQLVKVIENIQHKSINTELSLQEIRLELLKLAHLTKDRTLVQNTLKHLADWNPKYASVEVKQLQVETGIYLAASLNSQRKLKESIEVLEHALHLQSQIDGLQLAPKVQTAWSDFERLSQLANACAQFSRMPEISEAQIRKYRDCAKRYIEATNVIKENVLKKGIRDFVKNNLESQD